MTGLGTDEVRVIGVGNPDRGDDALGRLVAARLARRRPPGVRVLEARGEITGLLEALDGARAVVLVDAARAGGAPGSVHRIDAAGGPLPAALFECSTHDFGVAAAVELARALGRLPARCVVLAVEGRSYAHGAPPSPAVARAVPEVEARVLAELEAWRPEPTQETQE